jgi:hypothetical protein
MVNMRDAGGMARNFICDAKVLDKNDTREISHPDINIHDGSRIVVNDILCEI